MICSTLENVWIIPVTDADFPEGEDSVSWFQEFLGKTWEKLNRPCSAFAKSDGSDFCVSGVKRESLESGGICTASNRAGENRTADAPHCRAVGRTEHKKRRIETL